MPKPEIIIISALARSNRVIGNQGKVPWSIPEDSKRFQQVTLGYPIIMGRKTWEYDLEKCPLPSRRNIVISSSSGIHEVSERCRLFTLGLTFVTTLQAALNEVSDCEKAFIVGGGSIYAQALDSADVLDLTLVEGNFEGDAFFPAYEHLLGTRFQLTSQDEHPGFSFETYRRISPSKLDA